MNPVDDIQPPAMRRRRQTKEVHPGVETEEVEGKGSRWSTYGKLGWMMRDAKEAEVRTAFEEMLLPEALELLAACRKNIEIAAKIINQRITAPGDNEKCTGCGGPPKKRDPQRGTPLWVMQGSAMDRDTGLMVPYRFCDVFCVRERNKAVLLPKGDSGIGADGRALGDIK
jgi:hypothetical protein